MTEYKPGELLKITLRAHFAEYGADGAAIIVHHLYRTDDGTAYVSETCLRLGDDLTIERVAPAEWPPQPGDLWRREEPGDVWFTVFDNYGRKLVMLPANPAKGLTAYEPDDVLARGLLTLVHREGAES